MLQLMGCFAEFERDVMLERQREGVAKAKAEGKHKGRVPTARRKGAAVIELRRQGNLRRSPRSSGSAVRRYSVP
jgi:DNA invertase Pin-like site-specific DNA recombinase